MARCALIMLLSLLSLMLWIASIALCVTIGVYVGTQDSKYCTVVCLLYVYSDFMLTLCYTITIYAF